MENFTAAGGRSLLYGSEFVYRKADSRDDEQLFVHLLNVETEPLLGTFWIHFVGDFDSPPGGRSRYALVYKGIIGSAGGSALDSLDDRGRDGPKATPPSKPD